MTEALEAQTADELLRLEHAWMEAVQRHDTQTLLDILADDFTHTSWASGGEVLSRDEYLNDVPAARIDWFDLQGCSAQLYDHAAVLKCRLKWKAQINKRPWEAEFLISDIWLRKDGKWQAVSRHASIPRAEDFRARG